MSSGNTQSFFSATILAARKLPKNAKLNTPADSQPSGQRIRSTEFHVARYLRNILLTKSEPRKHAKPRGQDVLCYAASRSPPLIPYKRRSQYESMANDCCCVGCPGVQLRAGSADSTGVTGCKALRGAEVGNRRQTGCQGSQGLLAGNRGEGPGRGRKGGRYLRRRHEEDYLPQDLDLDCSAGPGEGCKLGKGSKRREGTGETLRLSLLRVGKSFCFLWPDLEKSNRTGPLLRPIATLPAAQC